MEIFHCVGARPAAFFAGNCAAAPYGRGSDGMKEEQERRLEQRLCQEPGGIAGLVIRKDGEVRWEWYRDGFSAVDCAHVYSVTKSVISVLIGIALAEGRIRSIDQKVLSFFPDYTPKRGEKTIQNITLRNLLTMTAPYKYKSAPYTKYFSSAVWVKTALDLLGGKGQIGDFRYTPVIGPDILSGVLQSATGQTVLAYATEKLFAPLGFSPKRRYTFPDKDAQLAWYKKERYSGEWIADQTGLNTAGWGLTLTAGEMARLGQLCLDGGVWQGRRLIPAEWVNQSTTVQSRWAQAGLGYGYLWWIPEEHCFAALGDGGNAIYVNKAKRLVVSVAAGFKRRVPDRISFIKEQIEPLF